MAAFRRTAIYLCLSCGKRWSGPLGPTECPYCGHLYAIWEDYDSNAVLAAIGLVLTPALKRLAAR